MSFNSELFPGSKGNELESSPSRIISFYGYAHDPLNIEGVDRFIQAAENFFINSFSENRIIYLESALGRASMKAHQQADRKLFGYAGQTLRGAYFDVRSVTLNIGQLQKLKREIKEAGLKGVINRKMIPGENYHLYYLALALDDLRSKYPFQFDFESHSDSVIKTVGKLAEESGTLDEQTYNLAIAGDFGEAIKYYRKFTKLDEVVSDLREHDITTDIKNHVKSSGKKGVSIFIPFGATHVSLADKLEKYYDNKNSGTTSFCKNFSPDAMNRMASYPNSARGEMSDIDILREILILKSLIYYKNYCQMKGKISEFALSYETLALKLGVLIDSLPIDQICSVLVGNTPEFRKFIADIFEN